MILNTTIESYFMNNNAVICISIEKFLLTHLLTIPCYSVHCEYFPDGLRFNVKVCCFAPSHLLYLEPFLLCTEKFPFLKLEAVLVSAEPFATFNVTFSDERE